MGTSIYIDKSSYDGWINYDDATTKVTPLAYTTGSPLKLTNDGLGAQSQSMYKPLNVTKLWNPVTNQIDFSELVLGDMVFIRISLDIETLAINQEFDVFITFDIGGTPYNINFHHASYKATGTKYMVETEAIYMGNAGTINNPAEIYFESDANANVTVNGFLFLTNAHK